MIYASVTCAYAYTYCISIALAFMPIVHIPVNASLAAAPLVYPGAPSYSNSTNLRLPHLVFCGMLDIKNCSPLAPPVNVAWLFSMFNAALDDQVPHIQVSAYKNLSISWKRALSESVANSTSLAVALFVEKFDWAVPVTLCKNIAMLPLWWPWFPALVQVNAIQPNVNMPDFLIAKTINGFIFFSTLEVKGRDKPVDTAHLAEFGGAKGFKAQSINAQLSNIFGNLGPALVQKILSVVSIRPGLLNPIARTLKCRWFNHASEATPAPPGSLTQAALMQLDLALNCIFGFPTVKRDSDDKPLLPPAFSREELPRVALEVFEDGYVVPSSPEDPAPWRPFISRKTVGLCWRLHELWPRSPPFLRRTLQDIAEGPGDQEFLRYADNLVASCMDDPVLQSERNEPMLRIGIGLKFVG